MSFLNNDMMRNPNWHVRLEVAKRISPDRLPEMMEDSDWLIRSWVAHRIAINRLPGVAERISRQGVRAVEPKPTHS